jgi:AAA15 family ATPase/GTPase
MNDSKYQSEIRDSLIRDLIEKVRKQNYERYLLSVRLESIRLFHGARINFDFPVTALIGPNGGGKSTILGAIAILHKSIHPKTVFRKSRIGDDAMDNWKIEYDLIDKTVNPKGTLRAEVTFQKDTWNGIGISNRPVKILGISRTVPALENATFAFKKKLTTPDRPNDNTTISTKEVEDFNKIKREAERILGKGLGNFQILEVTFNTTKTHIQKQRTTSRQILDDGSIQIIKKEIDPIVSVRTYEAKHLVYVGDNHGTRYSEFHFGAGEASVIRTVAEIETIPDNSLLLLEEIENGLHPLAVRRLVEYLMDVAKRKNLQTIFTTHSDYALAPLPSEAIWASIDGKLEQGNLSIEVLRAVSGRVDKKLAIFVEDEFAKNWIEAIIREKLGDRIDEIGVYPVHGDGNAVKTHLGHLANPAIQFHSMCLIDGDSKQKEDETKGVFRLPGTVPESTVFDAVLSNLKNNIALLTVACQRSLDKQDIVAKVVQNVSRTNRDPHLLFSQIGIDLGFIPEAIVKGAFFSMWIQENPKEANLIGELIMKALEFSPK